jgi:O-antigen biosynthesis protein
MSRKDLPVHAFIRKLKSRPRTRKIGVAAEYLLSWAIVVWSGVFDQEWYHAQLGRTFPLARLVGSAHYVFEGRKKGYSPHPLFEAEYFDPDGWRSSTLDPFAKYLRNPKNWNKKAHPWFDGAAYLASVPEASKDRAGPLGHFHRSAGPDSPLPTAGQYVNLATVTWGPARDQLMTWLGVYRDQERLRRITRITPDYDRAVERRFLRRWSGVPLPVAPPGDPVVSVIVPVWNRADEVRTAIASVQAQTFNDWELLVVDDGSTDESAPVVASIAAEDSRIRLLRQSHSGVSRARNLALEQARGLYVAFLDSDNAYRPHFLRTALAAMATHGWRAAYAALELRMGTSIQYRQLDAGRELLALRNHIDLNALVIERSLVEQVGGFDEQLRRSVDYDLVLRIAEIEEPHYLPFIGALYDHASDDHNRMTNRELQSWLEVVQNNNFIDWSQQNTGRIAGRVSVLIPTYEDWQLTQRCLQSLVDDAGEDDLEIVVVDNASRRAVGAILTAISAIDPRIRVVREPLNRNFGLGSNLAFAHCTGDVVVFLNNDTEVQPGWLEPLRRAMENPATLAVQPLLVYPEGTVQCAGVVFPSRGVFPVHFLAHHPTEDAKRVGRSFNLSAVTGAALAVRAADVVALRGFDPIYTNGWEDVDLCLRLRQLRPGTLAVVTDSIVVHHEGKTGGRSKHTPLNRKVFRERWSGRVPRGDEDLWRAAGFSVAHYRVDKSTGVARPEVARPVLTRRIGEVSDGPANGLPAFRWAIKIAAPAGDAGLAWGDRHFALALAAALRRLGQDAVVDFRGAHDRDTAYLDDVVLVLRGLSRVEPQPGRVNLLWVISHPDRVDVAEMQLFDGVFSAGVPWAERMSEQMDQPVQTLLQCTDPERFRPDCAVPDTGDPVLFVGNSRNIFRPVVRDAIAAGADVAIYGTLWNQFVDGRHIRGPYLSNEQLAVAYRSAGVVLNDHWDDMRREGFLSNRVFDATAAGARLISDDVPGVEELFGGLVQTYRTVDDLRELLRHPAEVFPAEKERSRLAEVVRREHSFDARARVLLDEAVRLWKQ